MHPVSVRTALRSDIERLQEIRGSVRENVLGPTTRIGAHDYLAHLEPAGRTWVAEVDGRVVGFAAVSLPSANVWALFVEPAHEGRGAGRALHDALVEWLREHGYARVTLSTDPDTRASRFYETAGWQRTGVLENGEVTFALGLDGVGRGNERDA